MERAFTREELYALVWSEPMSKLAKRFDLSDVGLAKACRRSNIPLPNRGYWAKREAGKSVVQAPLPLRGFGQSNNITIGSSRYSYSSSRHSDEDLLANPIPPPPRFADDLEVVTARAVKMAGRVVVPREFARMHPAVRRLFDADEQRAQKFRANGYSWDAPLFVSPYERRRLAILNAIGLALANCGGGLSFQNKEAREFHFDVGDVAVSGRLEGAGVKVLEHGIPQTIPSKAKLTLKISHWRSTLPSTTQWADADGRPLERQLSEIVAAILVSGEWVYRDWQHQSHQYLVDRKAELEEAVRKEADEVVRKEREQVIKLEKMRRQQLIADVRNWRRASEIRAFVAAASERLGEGGDGNRNEWSVWALAEADRLDPLLEGA